MKKLIYTLALGISVLFSCNDKDTRKVTPQKFKVIQVTTQTVPVYREFVGQIYGKSDVPIRARVEGFLQEIHFKEGSNVKKGQLLYSIDPDPFKQKVASAESDLAKAKTNLIQKESDLKRIEPLVEINAISKRELDIAISQHKAAMSEVKSAKAYLKLSQINLGYSKIYAPFDGLIGKTLAREGEFVGKSPNPVILNTVSDIDEVRVQFFLSENEYLSIAREYRNAKKDISEDDEESPANTVQLIFSDDSEYELRGHVDFIDRSVDPNTGAILLQASFPNPDQFIRPGQFGRVKINVRNAKNAILVPQKCLKELQGKYSILTIDSDNKVINNQVEVGQTVNDLRMIISGISAGDKVLLEGIQKVRPGQQIVPDLVEYKSRIQKK